MKKRLATWLLAAFLALNLAAPAHAQYAEQAQFGTATGTNALALTVPALAGVTTPPLDVPFRFIVPNTNTGAVTVTFNGGSAIAVKTPVGSSLVALAAGQWISGMYAVITYDGTEFQSSTVISLASANAPAGAFANLKIVTATNTATTITATSVTLANGSGAEITVTGVNCPINEAASGPGGLDTGSLTSTTWYYFYVLSSGSAANCVASASSSAPASGVTSSYPYYARVGADITDGAAHLMRVTQSGRDAQYVITATTNTAAMPVAALGSSGSISAPTWTAVSVSGLVPPTAARINVAFAAYGPGSDTTIILAPNSNYGAASGSNPPPCFFFDNVGASGVGVGFICSLGLEGPNIYYASNGGSGAGVLINGWKDNL